MRKDKAIGIFGGTFDPVHFGHLRAATEAKEKLAIQDFRLLPAGNPPHRKGTYANGCHRLAMLRLAVADHPDIAVDDREVQRGGASYMADTLQDIRHQSGDYPLLLFVGQDAANRLDTWHRWKDLFDLAHVIIMTRPQSPHAYSPELAGIIQARETSDKDDLYASPQGRVYYLEVTQLAISSTDIRSQVNAGLSPRFLLPDRILGYIHYHGLYRRKK